MCQAGKRRQSRTKQQDPAPEPTENRYFTTVKVGTFIAEALIDPGATTSFVNPEMARQGIDIGWQEANEEWAAGLADDSETQITTCVTGRVEVDNNEITHKFLVMYTLGHPILLGMDILQKLNIKLYINGKLLNPRRLPANMPPIGLQELTIEQKQKLYKLIDYEKKRFETVAGVTSITKGRRTRMR